MEIRIFGLADDSIVDGPGVRYTVFVQGCPHHCPGCHNPASHDFSGGTLLDTDGIIRKIGENPLLDGVTLSGGEPMCQPDACRTIADAAHAKHAAMGCICFENPDMGIYFIEDPDGYWLEIVPA